VRESEKCQFEERIKKEPKNMSNVTLYLQVKYIRSRSCTWRNSDQIISPWQE